MATATLKRFTVKAKPKVSEEVKQIAREAQVVLKHHDLAGDVIGVTEKLSCVLRRLDIKPYDWRTVRDYKESKKEEANKKSGYHYWGETKIADAVNVPPFVLRKAIQIKLACPDVKLFIEELTESVDPFLVAKLGNETFWIEVWNEHDFEKGL